MRAQFYFFSTLILFFSFGCEDKLDHDGKTIEFGDLQSGESIHIVTNQSSELVYYNVAINGKGFIQSLDDLVTRIDQGNGKTRQENVWMFTSSNSYHFVPLTEKKWYHDPVVFFNSIGFGYCDDVSIINSIIWKGMGYNSRIWNINLGTHIVSEVSVNGIDWQLFDSDLGLVFKDGDEFMSIEKLSQVSVIDNATLIINDDINNYRKKYVADQMLLWDSFKYNYGSTNNYVETSRLEDFKSDSIYDYRLGLPSGGQLLIGRMVGDPLTTSNVEGQNWLVPDYYNLIIRIESTTNFSYSIPLVLQDITGDGVIEVNGVEYLLPEENESLIRILNQWESSIGMVTTKDVIKLELTYLLNPLKFDKNNNVRIVKLD